MTVLDAPQPLDSSPGPVAAPSTPVGARERKRLATHRAIQTAALAAVIEHGLEGATVDEISRRAGVSPRTFFNYFPTKDEALVVDKPTLSEEAIEAFLVSRRPLVEDVAELAASTVHQELLDMELVNKRRELGRRYPQLASRRYAVMSQFEEQVEKLAKQRLEATGGIADRDHARVLGVLAAAAIRYGWLTWLEHQDATRSLADEVRDAFRRFKAI